jgi:hypothetical protein
MTSAAKSVLGTRLLLAFLAGLLGGPQADGTGNQDTAIIQTNAEHGVSVGVDLFGVQQQPADRRHDLAAFAFLGIVDDQMDGVAGLIAEAFEGLQGSITEGLGGIPAGLVEEMSDGLSGPPVATGGGDAFEVASSRHAGDGHGQPPEVLEMAKTETATDAAKNALANVGQSCDLDHRSFLLGASAPVFALQNKDGKTFSFWQYLYLCP